MSNQIGLDQALDLWEEAVRERTAVGSREVLGWKAATTTHLLPCDLEKLTRRIGEDAETSNTTKGHDLDSSDEILELTSSAGYSSMSPFGVRLLNVNSAVSATPRSKGRQVKRSRTLEKKAASKQSKIKQAPTSRQQQLRRPQGKSAKRIVRDGEQGNNDSSDKEQEEESEGNACSENVNYSENCRRKSSESAGDPQKEVVTSKADMEAQPPKRNSSRAAEQASANAGRKKARLGNEVSLGRQPSNSSTGLVAFTARVVQGEASSAVPPTNTTHGARDAAIEQRSYAADRLLQTDTQPAQGGTAPVENDVPSIDGSVGRGEHGVTARATLGALTSPLSTASPTAEFVESVADGSAFHLLEQAIAPNGSNQDCPICEGLCLICVVPELICEPQRGRLYKHAHDAHDLEQAAPDPTLRKWIKRIRYAVPIFDQLRGQGEVCVVSAQGFTSRTREGRPLDMPVIIKEDFADRGEWTLARYADLLDSAFAGLTMDVRWHQGPDPKDVPVSEMVELCRDHLHSGLPHNPPNMLNLPDISGAMTPAFLRTDRFRLLDLIVERCKTRNRVGKQFESTPFDVASSRSFNMLAWPGAFSGAHVDSNGATWVRNLFGYKLWMFVPEASMTLQDWAQLAEDGDRRDPGDKARAVVLCPGDVFIMRAGLVHAVHTLGDSGPCLMTGGSFWDDRDLLHILEKQFWIGKNQSATNEPLAYQLAQIIDALGDMIQQQPTKYLACGGGAHDLTEGMEKLRSLGCPCEDCGDEDDCECLLEGRRCTPFCVSHSFMTTGLKPCMLEKRADSVSRSSRGERDMDYVVSDSF